MSEPHVTVTIWLYAYGNCSIVEGKHMHPKDCAACRDKVLPFRRRATGSWDRDHKPDCGNLPDIVRTAEYDELLLAMLDIARSPVDADVHWFDTYSMPETGKGETK